MSTSTPNRTCGSCGAPVAEPDVTCPRCGALLAAYEAPRGSAGATIATAPVAPSIPVPVEQVAPEPVRPRDVAPVEPATPVMPLSAEEISPEPAHPRQTPPATPVEPSPTPDPGPTMVASPEPPSPAAPPVAAAKPARRTEMKSTPHPGRGTLPPGKQPTATQRPASSPTTPPHAESSTGTTIVRFGIGFLILLFVMGIFDFHPLLLIGLMVIAFSMVETLRTSAKAAGRKTTSMFDPNRRDIR